MKRFNQLTGQQKVDGILFAKKELLRNIKSGLLRVDHELTESEILNLSITAAEESVYADDGKIKMELLDDEEMDDVPYYNQGGCV